MLIAHISDWHMRPPGKLAYGIVDSNAMMQRGLDLILTMNPRPDCVLVTGDLTDCGLPEEYALVGGSLARLPMPVYVIPGNHDRRDVMRRALSDQFPYLRNDADFLHYAVEDFPVRLVGLDTVVSGQSGGEICERREAWLAERLDEGRGRPTVVFMHHPPFQTGVAGMDESLCRARPSLQRLIAAHPEVERVLAGHFHRPILRRWAGTIGFICPGTAHQVALDLRMGEPSRWILEPPAIALHHWTLDTGMITHVLPVGDYGPAHDFVLDPDYPGQAVA